MEMKKYLRNNMTLFDKVEMVKQLASETIGISSEDVLRKMLRRLCKKGSCQSSKYGILKFSQQELVLDQILKSSEISPRTAYNWFLCIKAPEEVCELGREGKISQNEIKRRRADILQKSPEQDKLSQEILEDIRKLVEVM